MSARAPVDAESLPARPEAERSVLGSLLVDGGLVARVMELLVPEDFASDAHRLVYEACLALADRRDAIDVLTVTTELERNGKLDRAGGAATLAGLLDRVPDVDSVESYAGLVREASLRRQVILSARRAIRKAVEGPDAEAVLEEAQRELVDIAKSSQRGGFVRLSDIAERNEEDIQRIHGRGTMLMGLPTGFTRLNALTQGLQRADLIIIAARPGMGKTAFALNIASYLTMHQPYTVGFFSLEMSSQQLGLRLQCAEARVNLQRLREGRLSKEEKKYLFYAAQQMRDAKLFIDDQPSVTLLEMRARSLQLKQRHGLDAVFVDYLQIMGSRGKFENRTQEVSAFSRGLKALAKELKVPVIALSQLNRGVEQRTDKKPVMSDLRESGAIEQDADMILLIYREEVYDKNTPKRGMAEIDLAKHRNGETGTFVLSFQGQYSRFVNNVPDSYAEGVLR